MAKNLRHPDSALSMTDPRTDNLIDECKRQEESCLYTSTALFEWLKHLRYWKVFFIVAPIIFAALATALPNIFSGTGWIAAICVMLAGIATAVYKALRLDVSLDLIAKAANQYKALQDRFRQARTLLAPGDYDKFNKEFLDRMQQMDAVRAITTPPPESYFDKAQAKIKSGDYDFTVDLNDPKN
jgi:hypothetical protein